MTLFILIFFALTLYFAQNKNRVTSPISNARRTWSYILTAVAVAQFLLGFKYSTQHHYFIGAFIGAWAWFTYEARKGQTTWRNVFKTIILVSSSVVYLVAVDQPDNWALVVVQGFFLIIVLALQGYFIKTSVPMKVSDSHVDVAARKPKTEFTKRVPLLKLSKRTKSIIYWIGGIIIFIILLPFIIFIIDKGVDSYMHYFYSVKNIGKEEVDSCVMLDDVPISEIVHYKSDGAVDVYPIDDYYNMPDSMVRPDTTISHVDPYLKTYSTGNLKTDLRNMIIEQNKFCPMRIDDGVNIAIVQEENNYVTHYAAIDEAILDLSGMLAEKDKIITTMKNAMTDYIITSNNANEEYRKTFALYVANRKGIEYHFYGNRTNKSFDVVFSCDELKKLVQL